MIQHRLFLEAEARMNLVPDPGDGGTIDPNRIFDGVCELTASGVETRVLALADAFPIGQKLLLIFKASQQITVTQGDTREFDVDGTTSLVCADAGGMAYVYVGYDVNGDKAWRTVSTNLASEA